MRALATTLLACLLLGATTFAADTPFKFDDPVQERRYHALLEELRCLVCQNQSLEDSHAELAQDLRTEVHGMISAGRTDAEILEFMVQRYGDFVLYRPPVRDSTWPLWFGPFLLLVVAVVTAVRYSRGRGGGTAAPLSGTERERVRTLLQHRDSENGP